jgi:hypothetical protein
VALNGHVEMHKLDVCNPVRKDVISFQASSIAPVLVLCLLAHILFSSYSLRCPLTFVLTRFI